MEAIDTKTVGEIVAENYLLSDVFLKYGIDFCCQGRQTLAEVCRQKALNTKDIATELKKIERQGHRTHHFHTWQLDYLMDHILNTHHYYVWVNLPVIKEYALKVSRMLGSAYPETVEINQLFKDLDTLLENHMYQEEHVVFPYIRQLVGSERCGQAAPKSIQGTLKMRLRNLELEHEHMSSILGVISALSSDFNPPLKTPEYMRVLYSKLKAFQDDFYQHAHLENNILFPKAIDLEKLVKQSPINN